MPEPLPSFAPQWLEQRLRGAAMLEELRLRELRSLTETDAARMFSQLDPLRPYPVRASSGLIEQQRWFRLVLQKMTSDLGRDQ